MIHAIPGAGQAGGVLGREDTELGRECLLHQSRVRDRGENGQHVGELGRGLLEFQVDSKWISHNGNRQVCLPRYRQGGASVGLPTPKAELPLETPSWKKNSPRRKRQEGLG